MTSFNLRVFLTHSSGLLYVRVISYRLGLLQCNVYNFLTLTLTLRLWSHWRAPPMRKTIEIARSFCQIWNANISNQISKRICRNTDMSTWIDNTSVNMNIRLTCERIVHIEEEEIDSMTTKENKMKRYIIWITQAHTMIVFFSFKNYKKAFFFYFINAAKTAHISSLAPCLAASVSRSESKRNLTCFMA